MPIPQFTERRTPDELPAPPRRRRLLSPGIVIATLIVAIIAVAAAFGIAYSRRLVRALQTGGTDAAAAVQQLAGLLGDRTALVLLLNNTELRPGGGFIGTIGIVKIASGRIASFDTHDVYALDRHGIGVVEADPPAPIATYLGVKKWYLRDANWSPDFRASSREVLRAYNEERAAAPLEDRDAFPEVQTVLGVTPDFFADLLRVTGPITVSDVTFTPENLTDELEYQVEKKFLETGTPREQRKEIVGELGSALLRQLAGLDSSKRRSAFDAVRRAFRERHIMIFDRNAAVERVLESSDWAGAVKDTPGDYLLVADANLASLKSDPAVQRTISYAIEPDGTGFSAVVGITFRHTGHFDWKTTRYRTYTRVYAPSGSVFLGGSGAYQNDKLKDPARRPGSFDVGTELGKAVFGAFTSIEPGETHTLTFRYRLPDRVATAIATGRYRLLVQKQLGTTAHRLTLDLGFGKNLLRAVPAEQPSEFGDTRYRLTTDLAEDREFDISL